MCTYLCCWMCFHDHISIFLLTSSLVTAEMAYLHHCLGASFTPTPTGRYLRNLRFTAWRSKVSTVFSTLLNYNGNVFLTLIHYNCPLRYRTSTTCLLPQHLPTNPHTVPYHTVLYIYIYQCQLKRKLSHNVSCCLS